MEYVVIDSNLLVADGAVLLKHVVTNLLLDGYKVCLVSVVAFLHRLVNTLQHGVLPANIAFHVLL